jgi:hypothetical protein
VPGPCSALKNRIEKNLPAIEFAVHNRPKFRAPRVLLVAGILERKFRDEAQLER